MKTVRKIEFHISRDVQDTAATKTTATEIAVILRTMDCARKDHPTTGNQDEGHVQDLQPGHGLDHLAEIHIEGAYMTTHCARANAHQEVPKYREVVNND
jgi:hypothetical protein